MPEAVVLVVVELMLALFRSAIASLWYYYENKCQIIFPFFFLSFLFYSVKPQNREKLMSVFVANVFFPSFSFPLLYHIAFVFLSFFLCSQQFDKCQVVLPKSSYAINVHTDDIL